LPRLNRFQKAFDLLVEVLGCQVPAEHQDRLLGFLPPGLDFFHDRADDAAAQNVGAVLEHVRQHVPVAGLVRGQANLPQLGPEVSVEFFGNQVREQPQRFDGPPRGDPQLMDVLDVLVASLCSQWQPVPYRLQTRLQNMVGGLAYGVAAQHAVDPFVGRDHFTDGNGGNRCLAHGSSPPQRVPGLIACTRLGNRPPPFSRRG
jgi:hypothetical protein